MADAKVCCSFMIISRYCIDVSCSPSLLKVHVYRFLHVLLCSLIVRACKRPTSLSPAEVTLVWSFSWQLELSSPKWHWNFFVLWQSLRSCDMTPAWSSIRCSLIHYAWELSGILLRDSSLITVVGRVVYDSKWTVRLWPGTKDAHILNEYWKLEEAKNNGTVDQDLISG